MNIKFLHVLLVQAVFHIINRLTLCWGRWLMCRNLLYLVRPGENLVPRRRMRHWNHMDWYDKSWWIGFITEGTDLRPSEVLIIRTSLVTSKMHGIRRNRFPLVMMKKERDSSRCQHLAVWWHWFESVIRQSKASVNIVGNGLQVRPNHRSGWKCRGVLGQVSNFPTTDLWCHASGRSYVPHSDIWRCSHGPDNEKRL